MLEMGCHLLGPAKAQSGAGCGHGFMLSLPPGDMHFSGQETTDIIFRSLHVLDQQNLTLFLISLLLYSSSLCTLLLIHLEIVPFLS